MKLSDEIILKCKNSNKPKGFTIIDENYIVIRDDIEEYIDKSKRLHEQGVNYCGPVDYRKVDGVPYTLEYRAHGTEMSHYYVFCDKLVNNAEEYMNTFSEYMGVLQMLSHASEKQYLKFFDDIEKMRKEGLIPDYCHYGNLFYDKDVGFSFIDVYPTRDMTHSTLPVNEIFNIIINPKFRMRTRSGSLSILPQELKEDYNIYMSDICKKILTGLYQYGYPQEEIKRFIDSKSYSFDENVCLNREELQHKIEEMNNVKEISLYIEL